MIEAGADPAGIAQFAAVVVVAEEQRAEALARAAGIAEADDDELLAIAAFDLEPAPAAARHIGRVALLGDDAFEGVGAGVLEEFRTARILVIAIAQDAARLAGDEALQCRLAVNEPHPEEVAVAEIEEVEAVIDERAGLAVRKRLLQGGKPRLAVGGERDDLAVEHRLVNRQRGHDGGDLGEFSRPVETVAGEQGRLAARQPRQDAIAVELDLVQPVVAARRVIDQRRQLRLGRARQRRLARPRQPFQQRRRLGCGPLAAARIPYPVGMRRDRRHVAAAGDAERVLVDDSGAAARLGELILLLDQQPVLAFLARGSPAHADERPFALQLLAVEGEFERALAIGGFGVLVVRLPGAVIPEQHRAAAILTPRNDALEIAIVERMVLDMDGKALLAGIEARALGNRPALEDAVELEAEIVMQPRRRMLLDDKAPPAARGPLSRRPSRRLP